MFGGEKVMALIRSIKKMFMHLKAHDKDSKHQVHTWDPCYPSAFQNFCLPFFHSLVSLINIFCCRLFFFFFFATLIFSKLYYTTLYHTVLYDTCWEERKEYLFLKFMITNSCTVNMLDYRIKSKNVIDWLGGKKRDWG